MAADQNHIRVHIYICVLYTSFIYIYMYIYIYRYIYLYIYMLYIYIYILCVCMYGTWLKFGSFLGTRRRLIFSVPKKGPLLRELTIFLYI